MLEERLHLELENLKTDLTATVQQLDAKTQAVSILNASLEKCQKEKNEFKRMAEQVMNRYQILKRTLADCDNDDEYSNPDMVHLSTKQLSEVKRELSRCLDEKQEITTERDIYRNKCDRLNNELNYILSGDERKIVDIDTLITESKILKDRIELLEKEKSLALNTITKYKKLLDRKASKNSSVSSESCITPATSPKHQENTIQQIFALDKFKTNFT
ncbi:unnamed protein product [Heterobilharzia americana]|nr:unnamed protein product [Heterobilharzia americana]